MIGCKLNNKHVETFIIIWLILFRKHLKLAHCKVLFQLAENVYKVHDSPNWIPRGTIRILLQINTRVILVLLTFHNLLYKERTLTITFFLYVLCRYFFLEIFSEGQENNNCKFKRELFLIKFFKLSLIFEKIVTKTFDY